MILFYSITDIIKSISTKVEKFIDNVILDIEEKIAPNLKPIKIEIKKNGRGK